MARKAFLVAVIAALSTATFLPNAHTSQKIVGGEASTLGQFPYIVSLSFEGSLHCGGALISPTKVLTAGHCSDLDPKSLTVRGGTAVRCMVDLQLRGLEPVSMLIRTF